MNGSEPRTDGETRFLSMLRDTVQGIRDGQITNSNEPHQVLLLRERASFPLRLLEGMESYRFAYEQAKAQGASANPIHTRRDVKEWIRIDPPSFGRQKEAWRAFVVGWATGVIREDRDIRYTATGQKETVRFIAEYRDRFGMAKEDPLGMFITITGDMAKLMREQETPQEQASKPPKEAHEIVLYLCDHPGLREQIERGIEDKMEAMGIQEMGQALLKHQDEQRKRFPAPIVRPYQQAIEDYLIEINYNPDVMPVVAAPQTAPVAALPQPVAPTQSVAPSANGTLTVRERLANLKGLLDDGLITEEDFATRKATILAEI